MKKLFSIILLAVLSLNISAQEQWQEGKHYKVISDKATAKPEVKEFFSFWCPACYQFEPLVKNIKAGLDEDVKFTKIHVNFMGMAGPDVQDNATTAMVIGRALKRETELNGAIFNYIHKQKASVTNLKDLRNIFVVNGADGEEFDKLAKSFGVNSMLRKNQQQIDANRELLTGVPSFIINGKYQPTFTSDMSYDDIADLIVWLSEQK
jgi:thiol:disulfide interchange protein DsbA